MVLFSCEPVNDNPRFCKRITDPASPVVVTVGGGINRTVNVYASFVDGFC